MKETVELAGQVPEELHGERLDQVAAQLFPEYSRSRLQTWIKKGELLRGRAAAAGRGTRSVRVRAG